MVWIRVWMEGGLKLLCSLSQKSVWMEAQCSKQRCPFESDLPGLALSEVKFRRLSSI